MNNKNMFPRCKALNSNSAEEDFAVVNNDKKTMASAHQVLNDNMSEEQAIAEWTKNTENCQKMKNKERQSDQMTTKYAKLLTDFKVSREHNREPETSSEASFTMSALTPSVKRQRKPTQSNPELSKKNKTMYHYLTGRQMNLTNSSTP